MPFLINGMCFIYSFQLLILLFLIKFYNSYPFFVYPVGPADRTGVPLCLSGWTVTIIWHFLSLSGHLQPYIEKRKPPVEIFPKGNPNGSSPQFLHERSLWQKWVKSKLDPFLLPFLACDTFCRLPPLLDRNRGRSCRNCFKYSGFPDRLILCRDHQD